MRFLGVIPARGGSKGVPNKNIKNLAGKPLIAYTIIACEASSKLTRTIISTDDEKIASVSKSFGGDIPFLRPKELATDTANAIPVLKHALLEIERLEEAIKYDVVIMFQPTSPFKTADDIDSAINCIEETDADSVISVVDVNGYHPARMKYLDDDKLVDPPFVESYENQPRQELRPIFIRNGAIYAVKRDILLSGSLKGKDSRAWVMPKNRSINIDTELDFLYAEWLIEKCLV